MSRHTEHAAKREAAAAAAEAQQLKAQLEAQTAAEKEKTAREKAKAQRLLMRQIRAGGGGYFETDKGTTLGGSGVIG